MFVSLAENFNKKFKGHFMELLEIKKLLHHREPYLMVDKVIEVSSELIHTQKDMGEHPIIEGHFPGAPIVPGAMLQEMCTQAAGVLITRYHAPVEDYDSEKTKGYALGVLREVKSAKFLGMTRPDKIIDIKVRLEKIARTRFDFYGEIYQDERCSAKINFQLVNIPGELL